MTSFWLFFGRYYACCALLISAARPQNPNPLSPDLTTVRKGSRRAPKDTPRLR